MNVVQIQFPLTATQVMVQDIGCFGQEFYYQLQENGPWMDSWKDLYDYGVIQINNPGGFLFESPYFAIKGVAENGEEKIWTFDLTDSIGKEEISSFAKEGDGSMFLSNVLDNGGIGIQILLF